MPNPEVPVYKVQKENSGESCGTLHRNMFLLYNIFPAHNKITPEVVRKKDRKRTN